MKQELFDIALEHIRQQGRPSLNEYGQCRYRTEDGLSCAAAPFIQDYDPSMEHVGFIRLVEDAHYQPRLDPRAVEHFELVCELQLAHDSASDGADFMSEYEANMRQVARSYNLEYEVG